MEINSYNSITNNIFSQANTLKDSSTYFENIINKDKIKISDESILEEQKRDVEKKNSILKSIQYIYKKGGLENESPKNYENISSNDFMLLNVHAALCKNGPGIIPGIKVYQEINKDIILDKMEDMAYYFSKITNCYDKKYSDENINNIMLANGVEDESTKNWIMDIVKKSGQDSKNTLISNINKEIDSMTFKEAHRIIQMIGLKNESNSENLDKIVELQDSIKELFYYSIESCSNYNNNNLSDNVPETVKQETYSNSNIVFKVNDEILSRKQFEDKYMKNISPFLDIKKKISHDVQTVISGYNKQFNYI